MADRKKVRVVITAEVDYDPTKFEPTREGHKNGRADMIDMAMCTECRLMDRRGTSGIYQFDDVTTYTMQDFLLDLAENKIRKEPEGG